MNEDKVIVLTHEYSDKSAFQVCGATRNMAVAEAWKRGGDENHIYILTIDTITHWMKGYEETEL